MGSSGGTCARGRSRRSSLHANRLRPPHPGQTTGGHEDLGLATSGLLHITLHGAVMAGETVVVSQVLVHLLGRLTLLGARLGVLLQPGIDDRLDRIQNRSRARPTEPITGRQLQDLGDVP